MKKYLMGGIAALAMGAGFMSCSHDEIEPLSQEEIDQMKANEIVQKYNQAFVSQFGQPAKDQDWGFGSRTITRANTYMNGNMEKYKDAPTVGATEEADVEAYVHALTVLPAKAAPDWDTYFVTQIHEGKASYNTQKSIDNTVEYVAGNQMDELAFAMQAGAVIKDDGTLEGDWIHINNFNSANNTDWNGNTLVEDGGTVDFAYKSTADSKYHNRWIGIDGKDINPKYKDYYYICFDFEATGDQYTSTVIKWRDANNTPLQANIPGGWTDLSQVMGKTFTYDDWTTGSKVEKTVTVGEEGTSSWELGNVVGGNKVVEGNNDFTDWIIRLYKAKSKGDEPEYSIRVIGEDLTFGQDLDTDFDFNDVVFDVALNLSKTWIKIKAAGGTLPLIIGVENPDNNQSYNEYEIHHLLGYSDTSVMINTNADLKGLKNGTAEDVEIELPKVYTNAKDIPVYVKKNGAWLELKAEQGEPASKIGVDTTFLWCNERVSLKGEYPLFTQWVTTAGANRVKWY